MHVAELFRDDFFDRRSEPRTRVVVAEGDDRRREALCTMLEDEGYAVEELETGVELLHYLYNSVGSAPTPDLVICAAELEGIDGTQVCRISRAQNDVLPFIIISRPGYAGAFDSLELGEDACVLSADVDLEELKASVSRLAGDP